MPYFGDGDEFHLALHFALMPRIFLSLAEQDTTHIKKVINDLPELHNGTGWATFLRNHDELTLEMMDDSERETLYKHYAPESIMRCNVGIRRRLAPLLDNDPKKILLATAFLFSLPGSPMVYYGDEIGMGDDLSLPDRYGLRIPMQWNSMMNAGFSTSEAIHLPVPEKGIYSYRKVNVSTQDDDRNSLLNQIRTLLKLRRKYSAVGEGNMNILDIGSSAVIAIQRYIGEKEVHCIYNFSNNYEELDLPTYNKWEKILGEGVFSHQKLKLNGYEWVWLKN